MSLPLRIFLSFMFVATFSFAQEKDRGMMWATNGLSSNKILVETFSIPENVPGRNVLVLEMPFANAEFIAPLIASAAKGKLIEKVQLVYTTFRVSESFDQQKLNQQRLKNLHALLPDAFSNQLTEWELVGQTGAHSPEEGKKYFHGFVIIWRPDASVELEQKEMKMLDSLFLPTVRKGEFSDYSGKNDSAKNTVKELIMPDGKKLLLDHDIPEDSLWYYIKSSGDGFSVIDAKYGDKLHTTVVVTEMHDDGYKVKHTWQLNEHKQELHTTGVFDVDPNFYDSVFTVVMRRNNFQSMVLVCDVTGSMSPYTAQIFAWISTGISGGKYFAFVFFNDGDKKTTDQKTIGKTGGFYGIQTMRFDSVYMEAKEAMTNGDGGDLMENPVEASIWAIKKYNPAGDVVLVADNYSTPRDLELYKKLNRPVHIVLCGAMTGINPDYLFLARQTHGSIHTMTDDIYGLDKMKDGDVVKIGERHYELRGEKFVCLEMFSNTVH